MLCLQLGMEWKMESHTGSSRTPGEQTGVTMVTLRWSLERICAVSVLWLLFGGQIFRKQVNSPYLLVL